MNKSFDKKSFEKIWQCRKTVVSLQSLFKWENEGV